MLLVKNFKWEKNWAQQQQQIYATDKNNKKKLKKYMKKIEWNQFKYKNATTK